MRYAFVAASLLIAVCSAIAPVRAQQRAPVPIVLPPAPPSGTAAGSALFDAMLAISRAQQTNPAAAQTAAFQYRQALARYRIGDANGARRSAIEAQSTAAQPALTPVAPLPIAIPPASTQRAGLAGGLYGADAPAIDADSFLALARGMLAECASRHDSGLANAKLQYAKAAQEFAARNWQGTRRDAKAAIDSCARAQL